MVRLISVILFCLLSLQFLAQLDPVELQIPMRDGEFLAADLYLPNETDNFPVILIQTPYNKNYYSNVGLPVDIGFDIENSPYAFVISDWRCFFGSTSACTLQVNRGEDGYDTVEWIAEQDWCDGNIGTWGPSALGNIQFQTANEQAPHLKCAVPIVASPGTYYEKYYPGGALRTEYFEMMSFLFGAVGNFQLIVDNPYQNVIWAFATTQGFDPANITIPMLLVGGWYDHNTEENLDLFDILRSQSSPEVQDAHKIIMGPWVHGGTGQANVGSSIQGELEYPNAAQVDNQLARQFFDRYLLNANNNWEETPKFTYYTMGENQWHESENWPPDTQVQTYYLTDENVLVASIPELTSTIGYQYNPEDPSPTIGGKTLKFGLDQGPYDQRFEVENRDDVLVFSTPELSSPVLIEGKVRVILNVETDQLDTDFSVRLCDVYPDGRSMLLSEGIQRLRFRAGNYSVNGEEFASPNENYEISVLFESLSMQFPVGHKIRLVISSSNYPRYNRNMNTGAEMYPNSNPDTLVNPLIATNNIVIGDPIILSRIELPTTTINSIAEFSDVSSLNAFPNPANQICNLNFSPKLKPLEIRVYSIDGKEIQYEILSTHSNYQLNTEHFPDGLYTASIVFQDRVESVTILVHH